MRRRSGWSPTSCDRLCSLEHPQFRHDLGVLFGPPFIEGDRQQVLLDGDEIFPVMLAAIRAAQKTITFETYINWSGDIGGQFASALAERGRHGVKVHVLLDWIGSAKMDDALLQEMTAAGVQIRKFYPLHWSHLARLDNRTHRKLLVVDGRLGFMAVRALTEAMKRGVELRIVVPGEHIDSDTVRSASRATWGRCCKPVR